MTRRQDFEAAVMQTDGATHGMLRDLVRNPNGEYRSACERSAWWAWNQALGPVRCRDCMGTGGIGRMETCDTCKGSGKVTEDDA